MMMTEQIACGIDNASSDRSPSFFFYNGRGKNRFLIYSFGGQGQVYKRNSFPPNKRGKKVKGDLISGSPP